MTSRVPATGTPEFTVIIPARLASTRLPGKPLADLAGRPMVVRVAERARRSGALHVWVAADDASIQQACEAHEVQCLLTSREHVSGTERLAQAVNLLGLDDADLVVNVQGDEPLLAPELIGACARQLQANPGWAIATLATPMHRWRDFQDPNQVKVTVSQTNEALYFSRAPIPWPRDTATVLARQDVAPSMALRHIGLYAYRAGFLRRFPTLDPSPLEQLEQLEQLRALHHGLRIGVLVTDAAPAPGVDTPEDLERVRQIFLIQPGST